MGDVLESQAMLIGDRKKIEDVDTSFKAAAMAAGLTPLGPSSVREGDRLVLVYFFDTSADIKEQVQALRPDALVKRGRIEMRDGSSVWAMFCKIEIAATTLN